MKGFIKFNNRAPCFSIYKCNKIQLLPNEKYTLTSQFQSIHTIEVFNSRGLVTELTEGKDYILNYDYSDKDVSYLEIKTELDSNDFIYLRIKNIDTYYYSEVIKISSDDKHLTSRVDYKCDESDVLLSTQLCLFEHHQKRAVELDTYYQVSTKTQVSDVKSNAKYFKYLFNFTDIDVINRFSDLFQNRFVYVNYDQVNLFETIDAEDPSLFNNGVDCAVMLSKLGVNIEPYYLLESEEGILLETENNKLIEIEQYGRKN